MSSEVVLFIISGVLFVLSIVLIIYWRLEIRRSYRQLEAMLEEAITGDFKESKYDESMMSKVAVKLRQFLISSQLSGNKIKQEKEAIKSLISDISHQTKTPITNILLYLQLLSEEAQLTPDCKDNLELIKKQSEKLDFLIQALVKTSRLEAGIIALMPVHGLLNSAVLSAIEQVQYKADRKNISINLILGKEYYAFIDLKWTIEAIYNVVDNAVKYTQPSGVVTLSVQEYEMFVRLDVNDTGRGIPEDEITKVFQRFYRGREAAGQEGVGIGLYLTRRILMEEGGYIKLESIPKEGSTFSLFFQIK